MTKTITKQNFISYINKIKELQETEDAINSAGKNLVEFHISFAEHEQLIIDILEDAFDDQEFNWISYWIYELEFGIKWHIGCITDKDGISILLRDAGELYDLLVENMEERCNKD
ncbi:MAG: hypothetical protein RBQ63_03800 [Acholeplasmatales bacterium]|jgi:hypothetical protein|nr:hypothetical protein [Acholeplasmatales bacterium]